MFALCFGIGAFCSHSFSLSLPISLSVLCTEFSVVRFYLFVFVFTSASRSKYIFYIIITTCNLLSEKWRRKGASLSESEPYAWFEWKWKLRKHGKTKLFCIYYASAGSVVSLPLALLLHLYFKHTA